MLKSKSMSRGCAMDLLIFSNTKAKTHRQNLPQDFNELLFLMRSILIKKKNNGILKQRFIQPTLSEGPPWEATRTVKDQYCTVEPSGIHI